MEKRHFREHISTAVQSRGCPSGAFVEKAGIGRVSSCPGVPLITSVEKVKAFQRS